MYTEEQLRGIFRALVNENDKEIDNMYYSDFSSRLGFNNPNEKREEFYVTKEISRYFTSGPKVIHHFFDQTFLQKTADEENIKTFFEFKQSGQDWKDTLSAPDLFKLFTFQNTVISQIKQIQQNEKEKTPVEELFLTLLPGFSVNEFFETPTNLDKSLEKPQNYDLNENSFDEVQKSILQVMSDTFLSQVNGNEQVYPYSLDPSFYPEDFVHFPSIKVIDSLNLNNFSCGIIDARAGYICDKYTFNKENKLVESKDERVGSENFEGDLSEMTEN